MLGKCKTLSEKITKKQKRAEGMAQGIECLPRKYESLSSTPVQHLPHKKGSNNYS
jgi:hypothetical protein